MAVDVAPPRPGTPPSWGARIVGKVQALPTMWHNMVTEFRRVTWPERDNIRQMSLLVVMVSIFIGLVIAVLDYVFQEILVKWIPSLFLK